MKRITESWSAHFQRSSTVTIQVRRNPAGELQAVVLSGMGPNLAERTLRLIPHADGTPIDVLEAAVEVLATQIRQEIEGPPPLYG